MLGHGSDLLRTIEAKTASYYMTYQDNAKIITNRAASGAVTLTLPPTADLWAGWWVEAFNCVLAQNLIVASNAVDTLSTFNDLTADSVALQTASERAGGGFRFVWDGTGWLVQMFTEETQTVTIVT